MSEISTKLQISAKSPTAFCFVWNRTSWIVGTMAALLLAVLQGCSNEQLRAVAACADPDPFNASCAAARRDVREARERELEEIRRQERVSASGGIPGTSLPATNYTGPAKEERIARVEKDIVSYTEDLESLQKQCRRDEYYTIIAVNYRYEGGLEKVLKSLKDSSGQWNNLITCRVSGFRTLVFKSPSQTVRSQCSSAKPLEQLPLPEIGETTLKLKQSLKLAREIYKVAEHENRFLIREYYVKNAATLSGNTYYDRSWNDIVTIYKRRPKILHPCEQAKKKKKEIKKLEDSLERLSISSIPPQPLLDRKI